MDNKDIRDRVRQYFLRACRSLDRKRYQQEHAYVNALLGRLEGELDFGPGNGFIAFTPTIVADRGPGAAENLFGADFAIIFQSHGVEVPIDKAIISQAKNGSLNALSSTEVNQLNRQCQKMARITKEYMVLEAPLNDGAMPKIRLGDFENGSWKGDAIDLDEYFVDYILACSHGDRRPNFIHGVATSNLSGIKVDVHGLEYKPDRTPRKPKPRDPDGGNSGGMRPRR